jgi:DNA topoisomerase IA
MVLNATCVAVAKVAPDNTLKIKSAILSLVDDYYFSTDVRTIKFDGFLKVYNIANVEESDDDINIINIFEEKNSIKDNVYINENLLNEEFIIF